MERVYGGLSWPVEGSPVFLCVLAERRKKEEKTLELPRQYLEVIYEIEKDNLFELYPLIKEQKKLQAIYAHNENKYISYVYDFNKWRREQHPNLRLRASTASSFEAGVMKIKELVLNKEIVFPETSTVKEQLKVFSKLSLKNEPEYYAVSALTCVVGAFVKRMSGSVKEEHSQKLWY